MVFHELHQLCWKQNSLIASILNVTKMSYIRLFLLSAGRAHLLFLWEDKAGKPMLFALSMRTLAKVIAPFIFVPFISTNPTKTFNLITTSGNITTNVTTTGNATHWTRKINKSESESLNYEGMVAYPYIISGAFVLFVSFLLFLIHLWSKSQGEWLHDFDREVQTKERIKLYEHSEYFTVVINISMFVFAIMANITLHGSSDFTFSIAISSEVNFSLEEAKWLISSQFITATIGRWLSVLILNYCTVLTLQVIVLISSTLIAIIMTIYALSSHVLFWVSITVFSLLFSPVHPLALPFIRLVHPVNGAFVGRLGMGFGIGRILANWLTGTLFQYYGSRAVFAELTSATACCMVICGAIYTHWMYKTQKERKNVNSSKQSVHILFESDTDTESDE